MHIVQLCITRQMPMLTAVTDMHRPMIHCRKASQPTLSLMGGSIGGPVVRFLVVVGAPCFSAATTWSLPRNRHPCTHTRATKVNRCELLPYFQIAA